MTPRLVDRRRATDMPRPQSNAERETRRTFATASERSAAAGEGGPQRNSGFGSMRNEPLIDRRRTTGETLTFDNLELEYV